MTAANRKRTERPRELRRRVVLPARMRTGADWSDACILNVSSRGMMIQSTRPALPGSLVELRRGDHVINAKVMWREGRRLGLQSEDRVPVEEIMSLAGAKSLQLVASGGALVERRKKPRNDPEQARFRGRALEFVAAIAVMLIFAAFIGDMAHQAFAGPLAVVEAALSK